MSLLKQAFAGLYRTGAGFTGATLPKYLQKAGLSAGAARKTATALGAAAGAACLVVGGYFLAAIAVSAPMFAVAVKLSPLYGTLTSIGVAGLLGYTGTVLATTGFGLCRDMAGSLRGLFRPHGAKTPAAQPVPPAPQDGKGLSAPVAARAFEVAVDKPARTATPAAAKPAAAPAPSGG